MFTIYADGQLLYSSTIQETNSVLSPTCSVEIGKAGSVDFTLLPNHYLYNAIEKLKTRIVANMDGTEIFRGRVLNWETDFYKNRTVHCEGNLAYLLDTLQPPRLVHLTVAGFLTEIINEHNLQVELDKKFTLGSVVITDAGSTILEFDNATFRDTRSAIDSDLIGVYGGFLRTRTVGAITYLDYLKTYGTSNAQKLEFGSNIIDMTQSLSSTEIFTVLLPTGDAVESTPGLPPLPVTIESVNGGSKLIEHLDGISKYGRIVHVENFSGIKDPTALRIAGEAYIARVYREPYLTFAVKALDLHVFEPLVGQFAVGNLIQILSPPHGINATLTCLSIKYDLENIENTEFTLGPIIDIPGGGKVPTIASGQSLSSAVGGAIGGASGSGGKVGQMFKHITEGDDWVKIAAKKIELIGETILLQANTITLQAGDISTLGSKITIEKDRITAEVARSNAAEGDLSGKITVEANKINAEVTRAMDGEATLAGRITVESNRISLEVSERIAGVNTLSGRIDVTAANISLAVTNSTNADNILTGLINVEAGKITAEVGRAIGKENEISGRILITEENINLRVTKAGIITDINIAPGVVKINAAKLDVPGLITAGAIVVTGDLAATNANFSNLVAGTSAATILRASVNITSFGSMGVNGTLTAGRIEVPSGAVVAAELNGTNIYGGSIFLNAVNLATTLSGKAASGHNHDSNYLGIGYANNISNLESNVAGKLGATAKAADSQLLDGIDSTGFALSGHSHVQSSKSVVTGVTLTTTNATVNTPGGTTTALTSASLTVNTSTIYYYDPV